MPFKWRQYPRGYRFNYDPVIARCQKCGQDFQWLPPNFDMRHRYNRSTHDLCGGTIEWFDPLSEKQKRRAMEIRQLHSIDPR